VGRAKGGPDHALPVTDHQDRLVDARRLEPVQEARQEAPPAELDQPLRALLGERREALPEAGGENEAGHGFLAFAAAPSSN
jgi:hypothetical protein